MKTPAYSFFETKLAVVHLRFDFFVLLCITFHPFVTCGKSEIRVYGAIVVSSCSSYRGKFRICILRCCFKSNFCKRGRLKRCTTINGKLPSKCKRPSCKYLLYQARTIALQALQSIRYRVSTLQHRFLGSFWANRKAFVALAFAGMIFVKIRLISGTFACHCFTRSAFHIACSYE